MLQDLDKTLQKLIIERGKLNKNEIEIAFEQPTSEWASRLSRPTINCWCYDLRENVKLRNMEMTVQRGDKRAMLRMPPMRFDVAYLVTAWARRIEDEHQLLWRALGALAQVSVLEPSYCEGTMRDQPYEIPLSVAQVSDTAASFTDLWSVLDNQLRLGFNLMVTVAFDPEIGFEAPLIFERRIGVGQSLNPLEEEMTALDIEFIQRASRPDDESEATQAVPTVDEGGKPRRKGKGG